MRARKVRSGLTILGIVIGVTSVIAVASIIDGLNGVIKERVQRLGSQDAFHHPHSRQAESGTDARKRFACANICRMTTRGSSRRPSPGVAFATVFANRINFSEQTDEIRYGDAHVERFFLRGTQPEYIDAFPLFAIAEGRFISQYDEEHTRNVVAIGQAIADSLVPQVDPIGRWSGWMAGCMKSSAFSSPIRACSRASAWISSPAFR